MKKRVIFYAVRFTFVLGIVFYLLLLGNTHQFLPFQLKNVLSGSMEPVFQTGSMILIRKPDREETFNKGEVITFRTKEEILITHRIDKVLEGDSYVTKGDANDGADREPVLAQDISGVYTGITIPYAGFLFAAIQSRAAGIFLMILPGTALLYISFRLLFSRRGRKIDWQ
ncbi:signal peptidase I [Metabacillus sp. 84]|uniref:signal peptidase I n=1 Tax=unclassified Metabacillus TaxID=2675274 RepID=UPI003CED7459